MSRLIYVANVKTNSVSVCNLKKLVTTIPVFASPARVSFAPDHHQAYVSNSASNAVSIIDTSTHTVVRHIREIPNPVGVSFTPDGSFAYITAHTMPTGFVYVIDTKTHAFRARIQVGKGPFEIAISPDGAWAFVANYYSDDLSVIRTSKNKVVQTIAMCSLPLGICFNPAGQRAYISTACSPSAESHEWWIAEINPQNPVWKESLHVHERPLSLAMSPDGRRLYAASGDTLGQGELNVVDLSTGQEIALLNLSQQSGRVAVTTTGDFCLVTDPTGDRVAVIRTDDLQVAGYIELPVGSNPFGIATIDI